MPVVLKEGEMICPKCKGIPIKKRLVENGWFFVFCPGCHATGKVDWIENIVGKKVEVR